jgi:hypothetical protein
MDHMAMARMPEIPGPQLSPHIAQGHSDAQTRSTGELRSRRMCWLKHRNATAEGSDLDRAKTVWREDPDRPLIFIDEGAA